MKKIKLIGLILIGVMCSVMFSGCFLCFLQEKERGFFIVQELDDKEVNITALSELGQQQEVIILPEKINGRRVSALKRYIFMGEDNESWDGDNLRRVYLPFDLDIYRDTFKFLPKIEKIFFIRDAEKKNVQLSFDLDENGEPFYWIYYSKYKFDKYFAGQYEADYIKPANISYKYNYADSPYAGCYWIDDVGYGEKIEVIPPEPVRDGYVFFGWYKEAACLNRWVYDKDTAPAAITDEDGKEIYRETMLYAKWQ